jgi:hypothetical protein
MTGYELEVTILGGLEGVGQLPATYAPGLESSASYVPLVVYVSVDDQSNRMFPAWTILGSSRAMARMDLSPRNATRAL